MLITTVNDTKEANIDMAGDGRITAREDDTVLALFDKLHGMTGTAGWSMNLTTPGLDPILPRTGMSTVVLSTFVLLVIITVLGLLGNIGVIVTFLMSRKLRTPQNVFIVNLAVADTVVLTCNGPTLHTLVYYYGERFISEHLCQITAFLITWACIGSIVTIGTIAITRYISIVHPYHKAKHFVRWKCHLFTGVIWLYSFVLLIPVFLGWGSYTYHETIYLCCFDWTFNVIYNTLLFLFGFGVTTITIFFCYIHIYKSVTNSRKRIQTFQGLELRKAVKENKLQKEEIRLAIQLLVIFFFFNLCWLPYLLLAMFIDPSGNSSPWLYAVFVNMVFVNSAANPPLYLYFNRQFRTEIIRGFHQCARGGTVGAISPGASKPTVRENGNAETCV